MNYYISPISPRAARRWASRDEQATRSLPLNIRDDGEAYTLTALVPGLKAEDLTIQVLEDVISIEGEYAWEGEEYLVRELPQGSFRRALRLPTELDADKAEAGIENGVLTLRVPKAESARPRTIKVSAN